MVCRANVAKQNNEFVILMSQQFFCGEPVSLTRPEPGQVVKHRESHRAHCSRLQAARPVKQTAPRVKPFLPFHIITIMPLPRALSLNCSMYRFNCNDSLLEDLSRTGPMTILGP